MPIVYFGTSTFAVPALQILAEHVSLVVTQPDRPSGRGKTLQPTPVKLAAMELGIPVEAPEKSRAPEFVEKLRAQKPDVLIVAAYGQLLSTKMLDSATRGGINLHGSILPEYRGAAPIQRCLMDGRTETGVTLMQMDRGMDTGDIIDIARTRIDPNETYGELQDRLAEIGAELIHHWLPRILAGEYPRTKQVEADSSHAPKVEKAEAELSFERAAVDEHNRFRAFTPSPGAFIHTRHGLIKLSRMRVAPLRGDFGIVLKTNPLTVAFQTGSLIFDEIQPEGKKRMTGADFANGARLRPGDCLL